MKFFLICIVMFGVFGGYWFFQGEVSQEDSSQTDENEEISSDSLDLRGQGLTRIPLSVFNQTMLEELDVSNNQLTGAIQGEIRFLQNLRVLDASDNLMTGVPAEIGQLKNLEELDLSNNQLTGLPYELGNLSNLRVLNLSGNAYSEQDLEMIQQSLPDDVTIITGK